MKKLLGILVLVLILITPSQANDIRDFQIEGMSLGDSLLDFFNKELIEKEKRRRSPYKNNDFFIAIFGSKNFNSDIYDSVRFHLRRDDKTYKIYHVAGIIDYQNEDFKKCVAKKNDIANELVKLFGAEKKQEGKLKKHAYDKSGNSITQSTYFNLSDGRIRILCTDWSKKLTNEKNWRDTLTINIYSNEFRKWLKNKAYK